MISNKYHAIKMKFKTIMALYYYFSSHPLNRLNIIFSLLGTGNIIDKNFAEMPNHV